MKINNNQFITIMLSEIRSTDGDIISVSTSFTTKLTPMLATPLSVREIVGAYIEDISDDILNQLILKYSIEAYTLAVCDTSLWPKWEYYASLWVRYKVAIDAIYNSKSFLGDSAVKVYKKIGDFAISKDPGTSGGSGPARSLISKLECEIFKLNQSVRLCREPLLDCKTSENTYNPLAAQLVTKGENRSRPSFDRSFVNPGWRKIINNY